MLWSNWNTSNWNTYLKYIICNLYFVFYLLSKCILYFVTVTLHYITFFSVICIWNTIWAKQRISLIFLLWMDAPYASMSSTTGCTIQNLWVKELKYLSVHILQSRTFKIFIIKSQKNSLSLGKCYVWKHWPHRIRGCNFAVDKEHMYI